MTEVHEDVTILRKLALADAAFPEEYVQLKSPHPAIGLFLAQNAEGAARSWATSFHAQVREIGWRLYARGGIDSMITATDAMRGWGLYPHGLDEFMGRVQTVWKGIGFDDDPRGVYELGGEPED